MSIPARAFQQTYPRFVWISRTRSRPGRLLGGSSRGRICFPGSLPLKYQYPAGGAAPQVLKCPSSVKVVARLIHDLPTWPPLAGPDLPWCPGAPVRRWKGPLRAASQTARALARRVLERRWKPVRGETGRLVRLARREARHSRFSRPRKFPWCPSSVKKNGSRSPRILSSPARHLWQYTLSSSTHADLTRPLSRSSSAAVPACSRHFLGRDESEPHISRNLSRVRGKGSL